MPIDNNQSNIKLNPEQTEAIEEAKARLMNLESETSIANKGLRVLKAEIEKATKEKAYQEGLLADLIPKVLKAKEEYEELLTKIETARIVLAEETTKYEMVKVQFSEKEKELQDREDKLAVIESEVLKDIQSLNIKMSDLDKNSEIFNSKVARFKEAIKDF